MIGVMEQETGGGQEQAKDIIEFLEDMAGIGQVIITIVKMCN